MSGERDKRSFTSKREQGREIYQVFIPNRRPYGGNPDQDGGILVEHPDQDMWKLMLI